MSKCKNCGEPKSNHLEGKRKYTDEDVLVCAKFLFTKPYPNKGYLFEPKSEVEE